MTSSRPAWCSALPSGVFRISTSFATLYTSPPSPYRAANIEGRSRRLILAPATTIFPNTSSNESRRHHPLSGAVPGMPISLLSFVNTEMDDVVSSARSSFANESKSLMAKMTVCSSEIAVTHSQVGTSTPPGGRKLVMAKVSAKEDRSLSHSGQP